jgi:HPt (histidine-containing phosphotransfer) domain-containing protein
MQLRDVTLDDPELMREIMDSLLEDTQNQIARIAAAITAENGDLCRRLAHSSKGACANVGANAAAAALLDMERAAETGRFDVCTRSLAALSEQVELLKAEAISF